VNLDYKTTILTHTILGMIADLADRTYIVFMWRSSNTLESSSVVCRQLIFNVDFVITVVMMLMWVVYTGL
jgi:hypothetical protein